MSDNYYLPIEVSDYKNVICFKEICDVHYWEMLDKYNTLIEDDCETFAEKVEAYKKSISLKYHLERRGMLN